MQKLSHLVIRLRWLVILGFLAITALFASRIPGVEVDPSMKSQLPETMSARVDLDAIEDLFGGTDMIMLAVLADDVLAPDTLRRLRKLSRKLERTKGVDRVMSLFTLKDIRGESGDMVVEPAVPRIPRTDADREALRQRLKDNDLAYGNVVAEDFGAAAIIGLLQTNADDDKVLAAVQAAVAEIPGPERVEYGGMPYMRTLIAGDMQTDMRKFLPAALLIMLIFLFVCFRQLRGVLLPFLVVIMSVAFSFGLLALLGWKIQMLTILLPVLLVAIANDYGIHMYARYQEDNTPGSDHDPASLARAGLEHLAKPVAITAITTIAGMLCLYAHIIVPAAQLGVLASAGIAFALAGSLLFIPAMLAVLPRARPLESAAGDSDRIALLERLLRRAAALVVARPRAIVVVALVLGGGLGLGTLLVRVDTNPVNYYPAGSPAERSARVVNDNFGGSTSFSAVAKGDVKDPKLLRHVDDFEAFLKTLPQVGQTSSITKVVKTMNKTMNDGKDEAEVLPETRDAVAQYFLLYSMSGDPEDFDRLVDFPFQHALLTARITSVSTGEISKVTDAVEEWRAAHPDAPFVLVGGFAKLFSDLVGAIVRGQLISLFLSLAIVATLVALLFRSLVAGLLAITPLSVSMALLFGLMGIFGIELNAPTAMLSSIMIGVGVDYTIHFLWRYREERARGAEPPEAVRVTLTTSGRGITFNALSVVVGFSAALLSAFLPVQFFGFLVVVTISACLAGALVLLPAVVLLTRPRFLEPKTP